MSIIAHIDKLNKRHEALEEKIHEAYVHHLPVMELKRKKLKVKDEIEYYKTLSNHKEAA